MKKKDLCLRDGLCCLIKEYHPLLNLWIVTDTYCKHFEWIENNGKKVGNCKIYQTKESNQLVMPGIRCISAEDMVKSRLQPESCSYSKKVPGYRCRVIGFEEVQDATKKPDGEDGGSGRDKLSPSRNALQKR